MSYLSLPQADIFIGGQSWQSRQKADAPENCPIVVLGGRAPSPSWLWSAASGREVWAADHGLDACMAAGIVPRRVLGDFDSVSEEGRKWLESLGAEVQIERFSADKDLTDFQLCLSRLGGEALVTGCWGGRFDHAFANIFSALWGTELGSGVRAFADESELLIPLRSDGGPLELDLSYPASAVSLLPLCPVCHGVSISGTKWELRGAELAQGRPYAVSNLPAGDKISVSIGEGIVGVYCFFENRSFKNESLFSRGSLKIGMA